MVFVNLTLERTCTVSFGSKLKIGGFSIIENSLGTNNCKETFCKAFLLLF